MATLRIAILKADMPMPAVVEKVGDYGPIFRRLLQAGARNIGVPERNLDISDFDVVETPKYPKLEDVDAVLITGSSRCPRAFHFSEALSLALNLRLR